MRSVIWSSDRAWANDRATGFKIIQWQKISSGIHPLVTTVKIPSRDVIFQIPSLFFEQAGQLVDIGNEYIFMVDNSPILGLFLGDSKPGRLPRTLSVLSALHLEIVIPSFSRRPIESKGNHRPIRCLTGQPICPLVT